MLNDGLAAHEEQAASVYAAMSARLRDERLRRGISVKRLAEDAGVNRTTVDAIEDPARNPTIRSLLLVTLALGLEPASLLAGDTRDGEA